MLIFLSQKIFKAIKYYFYNTYFLFKRLKIILNIYFLVKAEVGNSHLLSEKQLHSI